MQLGAGDEPRLQLGVQVDALVVRRLGDVGERRHPELRVRGFLRFMAGVRGLSGPAARNAVASVLTRFELEGVARRLIGHLSKGYRQRVSLAQLRVPPP